MGIRLCQDYMTFIPNTLSGMQRLDTAARNSGWNLATQGYSSVMGPYRPIDLVFTDRQVQPQGDVLQSDNALFDLVIDAAIPQLARIIFLQALNIGPFMLTLSTEPLSYGGSSGPWTGVYYFGPDARFDAGASLTFDMGQFYFLRDPDPRLYKLAQASIYGSSGGTVAEPGSVLLVFLGLAAALLAGRRKRSVDLPTAA